MGAQTTARTERKRSALNKRERELATVARKQHGVITRRQLVGAGLGRRTITRRVEAGRLYKLHQGVYALGAIQLTRRSDWMAAVLACGRSALLSHRSAAVLWGLMQPQDGEVEVTSPSGRGRPGIKVHEGGVHRDERTAVDGIPVTTVARVLFDLAEIVDERELELTFEEADRLGLLRVQALEAVCARGHGRRALKAIRPLIEAARPAEPTRSPLEDIFLRFCRDHDLPRPQTNVSLLGYEVDAYWPDARLVVESDSWSFHSHRAAFERDRARDAAMQANGYRVIRVTYRRLEQEPVTVAAEFRRLLDLQGRAAT
jgi:very-short-patch-repair endonuclease